MAPGRPPNPGRLFLVTALTVAALGVLTSVRDARAAITWRGGFETGNLTQWARAWALPGGIKVVSRPRHSGSFSAKVVVRPGDWVYDSDKPGRNRAELVWGTPDTKGTDAWYAWSVFFPRDFRATVDGFNLFTQFKDHVTSRESKPMLSFGVKTSDRPWRIRVQTNGGRRCPPHGGGCSNKTRMIGRLRRGVWDEYILHVKWSPDPDIGYIQVWRNGRRVIRKLRTATMYEDSSGDNVLLKQGLYRRASNVTSVLFLDSARRFKR